MESENPVLLRPKQGPISGLGKLIRFLGFWSAWVLAFIGVILMTEFSQTWYWFIPFLIPGLLLLPQKMRKWEVENKEKASRKAAKKAARENHRESSLIWKLIKIAFWGGLLWLVWYIGSYYLLVGLGGLLGI